MRLLVTGGAGFIGYTPVRGVCSPMDTQSRSSTTNPTGGARTCPRRPLHPRRRHPAGRDRAGIRRGIGRRLSHRGAGLDHPLLLGPDRGPAHQRRRHAERSPAVPEVQGAAPDLRQLDDAVRRLQDRAHARERAVPAELLLRHHQVRGRAIRPFDRPAARSRLRFRA